MRTLSPLTSCPEAHAIGKWGHTGLSFEMTGELALIVEAGFVGNFSHLAGGVREELSGLLDSHGMKGAGRDHHPRCFTLWMAGGRIKPGTTYGQTDDFSFNVAENPVHVRDLHATALNLLGIDHEKFSYRFQGLDFKLTGVEKSRVVTDIIA